MLRDGQSRQATSKDPFGSLRAARIEVRELGDGDLRDLRRTIQSAFKDRHGREPTWESCMRGDLAARSGYKAVAAYESRGSVACYVLTAGTRPVAAITSVPPPHALLAGSDWIVAPTSKAWLFLVSHEHFAGPFLVERHDEGPDPDVSDHG